MTREALEKYVEGMRNEPLTVFEPKEEVPDNLNLKINESDHIFKIQKRIFAVQDDINPQPKYEDIEENKEKN